MIRLRFYLLIPIVLLYATAQSSLAQLSVNLVMPSQMPERVPAWTEELNTQIQAVITNSTREQFTNVRLSVTVTDIDRNLVILRTKDNDAAMPRFTVPPMGAVTRFARDIISRRAIMYDPNIERAIITTNSIPEGNYEFCIRAIDEQGNPLSAQDRICRQFIIAVPDPPQLISPANGESVRRESLPSFVWTPLAGTVQGVVPRYRIKMVPVFQGQSPQMALQTNPVLLDKVVQGTNYQYLPSDQRLNTYSGTVGYAWQVQSVRSDNDRQFLGRNQGLSEIFTYGLLGDANQSSPKEEKKRDGKKLTDDNYSAPSTIPASSISGTVLWAFRKSEGAAATPLSSTSSKNVATNEQIGLGRTKNITIGNPLAGTGDPNGKKGFILKKGVALQEGESFFPMHNATVKLIATGMFDSLTTKSIGGGKSTTSSVTKVKTILLGTGKTDMNGKYTITFVSPVLSLPVSGGIAYDSAAGTAKLGGGNKGGNSGGAKQIEGMVIPEIVNYRTMSVAVIIESLYHVFESDTFTIKEQLKQNIDAGTVRGLARSYRLKPQIVAKLSGNNNDIQLSPGTLSLQLMRATSWYALSSSYEKEGRLQPHAKATILLDSNDVIYKSSTGDGCTNLFVNDNALGDVYYVRIAGKIKLPGWDEPIPLDTMLTMFALRESLIPKNAIAEVTVKFTLSITDRSYVRGKVLRFLDNGSAEPPGELPVVLVPHSGIFSDTTRLIQTIADATTGEFIFTDVPKGSYFLQTAAATMYVDASGHPLEFYAADLNLNVPRVVDTTIFIITPNTAVAGRVTNEIGNAIKKQAKVTVTNGTFSNSYYSDNSGGIAFVGRFGSNMITVKAPGHTDKIFPLYIGFDKNYGTPQSLIDDYMKDMQEKIKKAADEKSKNGGKQYHTPAQKLKDIWGDDRQFEKFTNELMSNPSMKMTKDKGANPLESYSPVQAGWTSTKARNASVQKNDGTGYSQMEVNAFGGLFDALFEGSGPLMGGMKSKGKDALLESDDGTTPQIIDLGDINLNRRTKLRVIVMGKTSSGSVALKNATVLIEGANLTVKKNTDASGVAILSDILPGNVSVQILQPDGSNYTPQVADVAIAPSKDSTSITVELVMGGCIRGVVKADNGTPVSGAVVRVAGYEQANVQSASDANGNYTLRGIPIPVIAGGSRSIMATKEGYLSGQSSVTVNTKDSTCAVQNFSLKKTAFSCTTLYGFPVEIDTYNEATQTVTGAFVKVQGNDIFSIAADERLRFKDLKIEIVNGVAKAKELTYTLTLVPNLDLRAFKAVPITVLSPEVSNNVIRSGAKSAKLRWNDFFPLGDIAWSGVTQAAFYLSTNDAASTLNLFRAADNVALPDVSKGLVLLHDGAKQSINLWSTTNVEFTLNGARIQSDGIHLKGICKLPGYKDIADKQFTINEIHLKSNGGIGNISLSTNAFNLSLGTVFTFTVNTLSLTSSSFTVGGKAKFALGDVLQLNNVEYTGLEIGANSIKGGTINIPSGTIKFLDKFTVTPPTDAMSVLPVTFGKEGERYFIRSKEFSLGGLSFFKQGIKSKFQAYSDGAFNVMVIGSVSANFMDIASVQIDTLILDNKELNIRGAMQLSIPNVLAIKGSGFHFPKNGTPSVDEISTSLDVGPLHLAIKGMKFGSNMSAFDSFGKDGDAKTGFKVENIEADIPGTPLSFKAGFYYFSESSGVAFGMRVMLKNSPAIVPVGPVTVTLTGGGFDANTASSAYSLTLFSSISIASADKLIALTPTEMTIGYSASGGPYVSAKTVAALLDGSCAVGKASLMIQFSKKYMSFTGTVTSGSLIPGVDAQANVQFTVNGEKGYVFIGGSCNITALAGMVKGNAAIAVGYNVPRSDVPYTYQDAFPAGWINGGGTWTGLSATASATIGVTEANAKCVDIWLCNACAWYGASTNAGFGIEFTNKGTLKEFYFSFNSAWGAGAKCGYARASAGLGGGLAGGKKQQGWYFSGSISGEAELCLGLCADLDIGIGINYSEWDGFNWSLDL
ncbi:MAG: carboxypeptidase regulatory-like domain-containing protein [Candidatus Kapabacteria bacterium]|nr:carboxypeptidase regulatory-like domain-containing protein [Candidatus Kapabacteria bacterium]